MKLLYIITAIILPTVLFSQNRTIVPLLGTIVFNSKEIITNEKLYAISLKEFKKGMMEGIEEEVILERLTSGIKTDSVQLKEAMEMAEENLSILFEIKNNMQYRHELKDNIINSIQSFNGEVLENNIIDTKTGMKDNIEYYSLNKVVDLREFKNERKKINGYDLSLIHI